MVAISVAVLATFLGICNVKDDNLVQGMQAAQADKIDYWGVSGAQHPRGDRVGHDRALTLARESASGAARAA